MVLEKWGKRFKDVLYRKAFDTFKNNGEELQKLYLVEDAKRRQQEFIQQMMADAEEDKRKEEEEEKAREEAEKKRMHEQYLEEKHEKIRLDKMRKAAEKGANDRIIRTIQREDHKKLVEKRNREREEAFNNKWTLVLQEYEKKQRETAQKYIKTNEGKDHMDRDARKVIYSVAILKILVCFSPRLVFVS
jgi:hypothetical protein